MASADRAAEHAVTKKALSDYRDLLVRFRKGSKHSADAGVPLAFRLDAIDHAIEWLDHWSPPPSALKQHHAVALAYELATSWGMKTLVSRKGKWHQLAQILYGDRDADLYRQVQTFAIRGGRCVRVGNPRCVRIGNLKYAHVKNSHSAYLLFP